MAPNLKNNQSVIIPNPRLALETVIKDLDAAGIYVLLDIHSCSNYVDWRKGRLDARPPYVDATRDNYDFKREDSSCSATNNPPTVTRIQAYDETKWLADLTTLDRLVFSPHAYGTSVFVGPQFVDQTAPGCAGLSGDAAGDAHCPLIMPSAALLAQGWDSQFGYLKAQGYAVVIGEWGGNMVWPGGKASLRGQSRYTYVPNHQINQQGQNPFA